MGPQDTEEPLPPIVEGPWSGVLKAMWDALQKDYTMRVPASALDALSQFLAATPLHASLGAIAKRGGSADWRSFHAAADGVPAPAASKQPDALRSGVAHASGADEDTAVLEDPEKLTLAAVGAAEEAVGVLTVTRRHLELQLDSLTAEPVSEAMHTSKHATDFMKWAKLGLVSRLRGELKEYEERCNYALKDYDRLRSKAIEPLARQVISQMRAYDRERDKLRDAAGADWCALEELLAPMATSSATLNQTLSKPTGAIGTEATFLRDLYRDAHATHSQYLDWVCSVVDRAIAAGCTSMQPLNRSKQKVKRLARAMEKSKEDYRGDYSRLMDLVRASIVCSSVSELLICSRIVVADQDCGRISIRRLKNKLCMAGRPPGGYRDVSLNLCVSPSGHVCELQLHLESMVHIKNSQGHRTYKVARQLRAFEQENLCHFGAIGPREVTKVGQGALQDLRASGFDQSALCGDLVSALAERSCLLMRLELRSCSLSMDLTSFLTPAVCATLSHTLEEVDLALNGFTGELPDLSQLSSLRTARLDGNKLTGPLRGDRLPPFRAGECRLYLNDNMLTGPLPDELWSCTALHKLWLQGNGLSGPIPEGVGQLKQLVHLRLANNRLSGEIPASITGLQKLTVLDLRDNELVGAPPDLSGMAALRGLSLEENEGLRMQEVVQSVKKMMRLQSKSVEDQLEREKLPAAN